MSLTNLWLSILVSLVILWSLNRNGYPTYNCPTSSFKVIMKILDLPGPKFTHPFMMKLFKRGTVKSAHGHGIGRHSEEEVKKIGLADLKVQNQM